MVGDKKGSRVNSMPSNALNKPVGGRLAKEVSSKNTIIIIGVVWLSLTIIFMLNLGFIDGGKFSLIFGLSGVFAFYSAKSEISAADKHKWKALKNKERQ